MLPQRKNILAVIGLGYVGLPLAIEFSKTTRVIGFDINARRIDELRSGFDRTKEVDLDNLVKVDNLQFTCDEKDLRIANIYIITVPTPIDKYKQPDLRPLVNASSLIGSVLSSKDVVIFESTVFPGATEEICVPVMEEVSGLIFNTDFFVGYSPERINPGDKKHRLTNIKKITSGSTPETAEFVDNLYGLIIEAGTHKAPTIKVAEAAKVIENTQRDVNIALINELAIIFNKLGIDTADVLEAASTKWNFLPFKPGLVGGHCIGVDPYYLTHKAQSIGYHPEIILAGRRLNDGMAAWIAADFVKYMLKKGATPNESTVLILGLTFKENCPDLRNTKVIDLYRELLDYGVDVHVVDPYCDAGEAREMYGIEVLSEIPDGRFAAAVLAVSHNAFLELGEEAIRQSLESHGLLYDLKSVFDKGENTIRL